MAAQPASQAMASNGLLFGEQQIASPLEQAQVHTTNSPYSTAEQPASPAQQNDLASSFGATFVYKMRGFYAAGGVYEEWVAVGIPNNSPPSGHTLQNIAVEGVWTQ